MKLAPFFIFTLCLAFHAHGEILAGVTNAADIVTAARAQIGVTTSYDPSYRKLAYPNGDVPAETGVCADVIVRALRKQNVDLQKLVHEDMRANFAAYPKNWGLAAPDSNIDHRRVLNLCAFFTRAEKSVPTTQNAADYKPGDIVAWNLRASGSLPHIGVVSDKKSSAGTPLIIHNIGAGVREEDILFKYAITAHFRLANAAIFNAPKP